MRHMKTQHKKTKTMLVWIVCDAAWRHFAGLMCQIECQLAIWAALTYTLTLTHTHTVRAKSSVMFIISLLRELWAKLEEKL